MKQEQEQSIIGTCHIILYLHLSLSNNSFPCPGSKRAGDGNPKSFKTQPSVATLQHTSLIHQERMKYYKCPLHSIAALAPSVISSTWRTTESTWVLDPTASDIIYRIFCNNQHFDVPLPTGNRWVLGKNILSQRDNASTNSVTLSVHTLFSILWGAN